jgi:hypothetical protein
MYESGTEQISCDVRYPVAIGGKAAPYAKTASLRQLGKVECRGAAKRFLLTLCARAPRAHATPWVIKYG